MQTVDVHKFRQGLKLRKIAANCAAKKKPLTGDFLKRKDSIARDYHSEVQGITTPDDRKNSLDILITKISFQQTTIADQQSTFEAYRHIAVTEYLPHLVLGGRYRPAELYSLGSIDSSMDYSLYVQYLTRTGGIELTQEIEVYLRDFYREINLALFNEEKVSIDGLKRFNNRSRSVAFDIAKTRVAILSAKLELWQIYGTDLFDILLAKVYPNDIYKGDSKSDWEYLDICGWLEIPTLYSSLWQSSPIFLGYENSKAPILKAINNQEAADTAKAYSTYRNQAELPLYMRDAGKVSFAVVTEIVRNADQALSRGHQKAAIRWICTLARF